MPPTNPLARLLCRGNPGLDDNAEIDAVVNCEICKCDPATLFVLVEQFDGHPKGTNAHKAHACAGCFHLLTTMDVRYHGLRVTEISQSEWNESEAKR